jgi:hypothetical protein
MSTQPDDLDPPPADDGADPPNPDPAPADPPEDNGADHPYAPLAIEMGWVPKDKFQGNPEEWKDPETFIRAGRDIQRDTASQLKSVRATLDTLTKTSASLVEQQVNERVAALREKHAEAVEAGDADQALKGFADMPKEAQDIARDMVDRNVIKSTDDYVRNYFANAAAKA